MKSTASADPVAMLNHFPHAALDLVMEELVSAHPGRWGNATLAAAEVLDPAKVVRDRTRFTQALDALEGLIRHTA